jgi:hypothetical protein
MTNNQEATTDDEHAKHLEFYVWKKSGIDRGWISEGFCHTHDGDPYMTAEEEKEWEEGGDPCMLVFKVFL